MSVFRKASRDRVPLKMGIIGTSGSGKTYSALELAKGLVDDLKEVCVIDSEEIGDLGTDQTDKKRGSDFYSDKGDFSVLPLNPPFSPEKYVKAIDAAVAEGFKVAVIDSVTHAWEGPGGVLDIHNKYGGRFQDWAKSNKHHQLLLDAIMKSPIHLILTMRQKSEHGMIQEGAKLQVKKLGMKIQQREGFEYDLHTTFMVEHATHLCTIGKDRTGLFEGRPPFLITEEIGKELKEWNN